MTSRFGVNLGDFPLQVIREYMQLVFGQGCHKKITVTSHESDFFRSFSLLLPFFFSCFISLFLSLLFMFSLLLFLFSHSLFSSFVLPSPLRPSLPPFSPPSLPPSLPHFYLTLAWYCLRLRKEHFSYIYVRNSFRNGGDLQELRRRMAVGVSRNS